NSPGDSFACFSYPQPPDTSQPALESVGSPMAPLRLTARTSNHLGNDVTCKPHLYHP
ncbi:hypothetical protein A2U01_0117089, partial [Trifolium medium]|nr:hypothetical protein [Trifolium medium]